MKSKVPKTVRYCLACEEIRIFEYNPTLGHSECTECGGRLATNITSRLAINPDPKKNKALKYYKKYIIPIKKSRNEE